MTYQLFSKRAIQIIVILMLVLFAWVAYHQLMSTMSMDSGDCITFCFIATKIDINHLTQSLYYSFVDTIKTLLAMSALAYIALYYARYHWSIIHPLVQRLKRYYHQQRWKFKLFPLWSSLYQQGIIAPQIYS
ncbi:MAG: hypothetical protein HYV33_03800 [Candidatus Kerfeldbacteria bacterium]|nr:hypothetical protein [Candidatus Kerfeldbacteria bacterium]